MRVLIIEPYVDGHRASYLLWLVQAARSRQWDVTIAMAKTALDHPALKSMATELEQATIHIVDDSKIARGGGFGRWVLVRRELAYWRMLKKTLAEARAATPVDAVILPYVDYCLYALGVLGDPFKGISWCGISMRTTMCGVRTGPAGRVPLKWRLIGRILAQRNLKALFVINPSVRDLPPAWYPPKLQSRLRYLPDPALDAAAGSRTAARAALGLSTDAIAILVFGTIDDRKGADLLVEALASGSGLDEYVVILAGRQSAGFAARMAGSSYVQLLAKKRLIVLNRFISESEQSDVFAAADVVWVGYRNHVYMSGVMVLAGRAGLPMVGTDSGEIGRLIAATKLGVAARMDEPAEIVRAVQAMRDADARIAMGQRAKAAFAHHTVGSFGRQVMAALDSAQPS
jgi:glycosyltransferase involved in cell wall biosynthesis